MTAEHRDLGAGRRLSHRETERLVERLVDLLEQPLLVVDSRDHSIIWLNRRACRLLGHGPAKLVGCRLESVVPAASSFLTSLGTGGDRPRRTSLVLPGGRGPQVELTAHPVELGRGEACILLGREEQAAAEEDLVETNLEFPTIVGQSEPIREVCRLIGLVAKTDTTVLVQGESGTGKELVAHAVHFHSRRARGPLVKLNCSALTDTLLESELFGHKKGAFTGAIHDRKGRFQLSHRGTIILDEIGSMSLTGQAKLLRVLQEREFEPVGSSETVEVDVRVVAVTNARLEEAIGGGSFREDLFYRLNAFPIRLPPLRERREDIPLLAQHFLRRCAASVRKHVESVSPRALAALAGYAWPGNVRELANAIEYAVILERGKELRRRSLPDKLTGPERRQRTLRERLNRVEKKMILEALSQTDGVQNRAAKLLGMDRRNLSYFLNKHHIRWRRGGGGAAAARPD